MNSVFDDIDSLIKRLPSVGCEKLSKILDHRLHHVAWTTGSELRGELKQVLDETKLPDDRELQENIRDIRRRL